MWGGGGLKWKFGYDSLCSSDETYVHCRHTTAVPRKTLLRCAENHDGHNFMSGKLY